MCFCSNKWVSGNSYKFFQHFDCNLLQNSISTFPLADSSQILTRGSLRGLVKCKACNHYNGIRATACKNKNCILSKNDVKRRSKPKISAIELASDGESKLFSVQIRDRDIDHRNFVSITEKIISSDASASIISSNAIW